MEIDAIVGDIIKVTDTNNDSAEFFSIGDIGTIERRMRSDIDHTKETLYYIDFNNHGNRRVIGDGLWYIDTSMPKDLENGTYGRFEIYKG